VKVSENGVSFHYILLFQIVIFATMCGKLSVLLLLTLLIVSCSSKQDSKKEIAGSKNQVPIGKDEITINTEDGKSLSAYFWYNNDLKDTRQPLIVLVHQFKQDKDQWPVFFTDSLLRNHYKVLAYDIRGHGKSSKVDYELSKLLSDASEAPADMSAVIKWAKEQKGIDSTRIAVIGTSIGGNLACFAKFILGTKVAVAISNSKGAFETFIGYDDRMMGRPMPRASNILLICGSKDGEHEADQKFIYDNFLMDPRGIKVYDSDKHGKFLLEEHAEIYSLILDWLKKYL
jgi:pimeloyl-ACP methyl ester carboxylesterase